MQLLLVRRANVLSLAQRFGGVEHCGGLAPGKLGYKLKPAPATSTLRGAALPTPRAGVEGVAQTVANQVNREHDQRQRETWKGRHPPCVIQVVTSIGDHQSPFGAGRLHAQTEK